MSSSREVTAQKKKDVWEDVGAEFYQESYPSGSKPPSTTHTRRPSRLTIPLPSQTARRGSLLQTSRHNNKSGARRKNHQPLQVNNSARRGLTYTSTMAVADAHGTTTNANDIQVAILPDLSEETILNEKKTWEELLRIKTMPVPMVQKKQLKAQLATIPKLRLKGWKNMKWILQKTWQTMGAVIARKQRTMIFLNNSLRTIELRSGTAIVNVFLFIKWTIFLNLAMSLALITFIIGPYITYYLISGGEKLPSADPNTCSSQDEGDDIQLNVTSVLERFLDCCAAQYKAELHHNSGSRGVVTFIMKSLGLGSFESWPISYSFYDQPTISYDKFDTKYHFDVAYVLTGCAIFAGCLILLVKSIAAGVKEIIHLREGEFYKYSNLVFSGWEHYTNDEKGAEFKRRVLRNEMKIALQTEKKKITDLLITKRQRAKIFIMRFLVNVIVLGLIITAGTVIFYTTLELTNEGSKRAEYTDLVKGFVPSFAISFFNLIFPSILARLGKLEKYSREWETALILLRSLFIRLFSIYAAAIVFYRYSYCKTKPGYCVVCEEAIERKGGETDIDRSRCWESLFADQIYRLILTDLLIKIVLTFVADPFRRLIGHCCKNKIGKRVSTLSFNIVRHSLDVIYIQILSWMSFYFAPFAPIFAVGYCILVFYIKKFSVLYNCKSVPDTFRTTRSTGMFMAAKIISFVVVLFTYAFIVVLMVPSAECGPFRGKTSAWDAVSVQLSQLYPDLYETLRKIGSPGIALPLALVLILLTYYYYSVAQANRAMVETLRHLLILEGHDKQYLFAKLNSLRRSKKQRKTFKSMRLKGQITKNVANSSSADAQRKSQIKS